jgi:hypothetical protein
VPPKFQRRGEQLTPVTPPTSGTQNAGKPSAHGGGQKQGGPGGRSPHGGGLWEVSPHETLKGGEQPPPATPPRVGPKTPANPQPTGVGKNGGSRGAKPPLQGVVGGVPPQIQKRRRIATLATPPTSGTQNAGEPSAHGGGQKRGWRGLCPLPGGMGDVPPE